MLSIKLRWVQGFVAGVVAITVASGSSQALARPDNGPADPPLSPIAVTKDLSKCDASPALIEKGSPASSSTADTHDAHDIKAGDLPHSDPASFYNPKEVGPNTLQSEYADVEDYKKRTGDKWVGRVLAGLGTIEWAERNDERQIRTVIKTSKLTKKPAKRGAKTQFRKLRLRIMGWRVSPSQLTQLTQEIELPLNGKTYCLSTFTAPRFSPHYSAKVVGAKEYTYRAWYSLPDGANPVTYPSEPRDVARWAYTHGKERRVSMRDGDTPDITPSSK